MWVFDAIPSYFNLYKWVGGAVLRDYTTKDPTEYLSPKKNELKIIQTEDGRKNILWRNRKISRDILVPIPVVKEEGVIFEKKYIPFFDGLVNIMENEKAIIETPFLLSRIKYEGMNLDDRKKLRIAFSVIGQGVFNDYHHHKPLIRIFNNFCKNSIGIKKSIWLKPTETTDQ